MGGESDWSAEANYSLDALTSDLRAVMATLDSKPALVGASIGGATSLYAVGSAEEPIATALVLVDVIPRINKEGAAKISAFMTAHQMVLRISRRRLMPWRPTTLYRPRPKDTSGLMKNLRLREDGRLHWHWDPKFIRS